jgi:hypothetical protein
MRPLSNIRRLFRGLRVALREPEVQAVTPLALSLIGLATVFYWLVEGWTLLHSAYFSVVTIATVGYGDLTPQTALGKIFTIGTIFAGIGIFVAAVTAIAQAVLRIRRRNSPGSVRSCRSIPRLPMGTGAPAWGWRECACPGGRQAQTVLANGREWRPGARAISGIWHGTKLQSPSTLLQRTR